MGADRSFSRGGRPHPRGAYAGAPPAGAAQLSADPSAARGAQALKNHADRDRDRRAAHRRGDRRGRGKAAPGDIRPEAAPDGIGDAASDSDSRRGEVLPGLQPAVGRSRSRVDAGGDAIRAGGSRRNAAGAGGYGKTFRKGNLGGYEGPAGGLEVDQRESILLSGR